MQHSPFNKLSIVTLIDSFKSSISSKSASSICTSHFSNPSIQLSTYPISDGGEGFIEALAVAMQLTPTVSIVSGPLGEKMQTFHLYDSNQGVLVLESAQYVGIQDVSKDKLNPLHISSYGLGESIRQILVDSLSPLSKYSNINTIIIGLGGTASVDCGLGLLQGLFGAKCYDITMQEILPYDVRLGDIHSISFAKPLKCLQSVGDTQEAFEKLGKRAETDNWLIFERLFSLTNGIIFASDVTNPLLGPTGATYIYGPQKGIQSNQIANYEASMSKFSHLLIQTCHSPDDLHLLPGTGAAGGIAFALYVAFYHCYYYNNLDNHRTQPMLPPSLSILNTKFQMQSGFDVLCSYTNILSTLQQLKNNNFLLTGEGAFDLQSLSGKVIQRVSRLALSISSCQTNDVTVTNDLPQSSLELDLYLPHIPIIVLCGYNAFENTPETRKLLLQMGIVKVININDPSYCIGSTEDSNHYLTNLTLEEKLRQGEVSLQRVCQYLALQLAQVDYDASKFIQLLNK